MSTAEIIAELPRLSPAELNRIQDKLRQLVQPVADTPARRIATPRLAHPEQSKDFVKQVVEMAPDAEV